MNDAKHSPLPWRVLEGDPQGCVMACVMADVRGTYGLRVPVAKMGSVLRPNDEMEANAALIVRAVNCHADLLAIARLAYGKFCDPHSVDHDPAAAKLKAMAEAVFAKLEQ